MVQAKNDSKSVAMKVPLKTKWDGDIGEFCITSRVELLSIAIIAIFNSYTSFVYSVSKLTNMTTLQEDISALKVSDAVPQISEVEKLASLSLSSRAVHADDHLNNVTDVAPPLHVSTTFRYDSNPDNLVPWIERDV